MPEPEMETPPYPPGLPAVFEVVRRLRAADGCPWDREQTHASLRPYLLEETYELLEALDAGDEGHLREELGDVLLQVAMHAQIAADEGRFDIAAISEQEAAKMVSRHPHVFGDRQVRDAEDVLRNAIQKRAARVGFDYADAPAAADGVAEEARELATAADDQEVFRELGDLLFALVNVARKRRVNPEDALRSAGQRFAARFRAMERLALDRGVNFADLDASALEALWADAS